MAAAVQASYAFTLNVNETLALGLDNVTDPEVARTLGADAATLNATTTPPVTKDFDDTINLVAGAAALDLTALAGPLGTTITFNGLKVQLVKLKCPSTNSGGITVQAKDAATGYCLFGTSETETDFKVEVNPGCVFEFFQNDKLADVDATHKDLIFSGTGTDSIQVQLVAG